MFSGFLTFLKAARGTVANVFKDGWLLVTKPLLKSPMPLDQSLKRAKNAITATRVGGFVADATGITLLAATTVWLGKIVGIVPKSDDDNSPLDGLGTVAIVGGIVALSLAAFLATRAVRNLLK